MGSRRAQAGFSLIEVTIALGVVAFALLTVLGLLPIGLSILSGAATQTGAANIAKEMSSEVQQIPLSEITTLPQKVYYYDRSGTQVTTSQGAYFSANFAINDPSLPGVPADYASIAKTVVVTLRYPQNIPAASQKSVVFALLAAQQSGN